MLGHFLLAVVLTLSLLDPAEAAHPAHAVAYDGLNEVNACRARAGMKPFKRDVGLTRAAMGAASYRASRLINGHAPNDFAFLPPGAVSNTAGCGALEPHWGWGSCCTYEDWDYAGAAWVWGSDGKRYMHLFVR